MTRLLLSAACASALFFSTSANAQLGVAKKVIPTVVIGAKVGLNLQQMGGTGTTFKSAFKPGILGGVFLGVDKKKRGIRVEALIKTAKFDISTTGASINTVYIDIPVMYERKLAKRVWLQVGPQFSSLISAKQNNNGPDFKGNLRNSDVSAVGGVEVRLPMKLTAGARYIYGFVNVNNSAASGTWRNSSIQVSVGYRFLN
jgi:hypothetical protein